MPQSISQKEKQVSPKNSDAPEISANGENLPNELGELRKILIQSEEVSEVLPAALKRRAQKDNQLSEATLPIVEENIRQSVQRNPRILAEAIFPIIGPAIRKAIAEALSQMIQSLNQTLENSLSPKGLRWRLEAMQTGKPFAEVVMLNSLLYRVEQVFLIHKKTGILLQHVSIKASETQDGEMVSAMLTAIQDFVHDSFQTSEDATLDSLRVKDFSIWIENSPDAILAAVIRGNAPLNLREIFLEAIEQIQFEQEGDLVRFEGDTSIFDDTKPVLQECLQMQLGEKDEPKGKFFTPFNVLAGILAILILVGGFFFIRDYWHWSNFLARLRTEPGIVVTEANRGWFKHEIEGLRDDLAIDPDAVLSDYGFQKDDVAFHWRAFQDLNPQFVLQRAKILLNPPPTVNLSFENGILTAEGVAAPEWFNEVKKLAVAIAGVREFRVGFSTLKAEIESKSIAFNCGTTNFAEKQEEMLGKLINDFENLGDLAKNSQKNFRVEIEGHADASGTDEVNAQISQSRADKILTEFFAKSENLKQYKQNFKAVGVGAGGNSSECAVKFQVFLE